MLKDLIHHGILSQITDKPILLVAPVIDPSSYTLIAVSKEEQLSWSCQETGPQKFLKNSVFCKFHMENERFCSDVVNAIIAAIQRPNKSFKISQKIAKSSKFDHCVPKPSNFFHFSNFFIQILIPKTLYIYTFFLYF